MRWARDVVLKENCARVVGSPDPDDITKTSRNARLAIAIVPPPKESAIALQCQTMLTASRNSDHVGQALILGVKAPPRNGAVSFECETVVPTCGDCDHVTECARDLCLVEVIPPPGGHPPVTFQSQGMIGEGSNRCYIT